MTKATGQRQRDKGKSEDDSKGRQNEIKRRITNKVKDAEQMNENKIGENTIKRKEEFLLVRNTISYKDEIRLEFINRV